MESEKQGPRHTCSFSILEDKAANAHCKSLMVIGNVYRILPELMMPLVHKLWSEFTKAEKYIFIFQSQLMQFILEKENKNQECRKEDKTHNIQILILTMYA